MKRMFITKLLLLFSLATICVAYAGSGPPPLQEVDVTGHGATEDAAFKQAVMEAVRQVVGSLVSAETLINNEQVIKDEVLTLSNGFVEKVVNQEKTKLNDGTWQVRLNCIVRKEQVYAKLQKANVPTMKFDGVSMFADVVSQSNFRKDAHVMLAKAVRDFLRDYPSLYRYECEKPVLVHAGDEITTVNIKYRVKVDAGSYYTNLLPPLHQALKAAAKEVLTTPGVKPTPPSRGQGTMSRSQTYKELLASKESLESEAWSRTSSLLSAQERRMSDLGEVMVVVQERSGWSVFGIEKEILQGCYLKAAFSDRFSNDGYPKPVDIRGSKSFILFYGSDGAMPLHISEDDNWIGFKDGSVVVSTRSGDNEEAHEVEVKLPTKLLPRITKVTVRLGLKVTLLAMESESSGMRHQPLEYSGLFDGDSTKPFFSQGRLVHAQGGFTMPLTLTMTKGFSGTIGDSKYFSADLYYLGDYSE